MAESSPKGWKTLWVKEKLLRESNFSFSANVFKRLVVVSQRCKKQGLVWERVKNKNHNFSYFDFVICKCFQFGPV